MHITFSKMTHYVFNKCLASVKLPLFSQNTSEADCVLREAVKSVISSLIILSCCFVGQRGGASAVVAAAQVLLIPHCHIKRNSHIVNNKHHNLDGGVCPLGIYCMSIVL